MRDIIKQPFWKKDDIGKPLPDSEHAVSVSIPTWEQVIGYEEGDKSVTQHFKAGYPRFYYHPKIQTLFKETKKKHGSDNEECLVFCSSQAADRCLEFNSGNGRIVTVHETGATAVFFPKETEERASLYWRYFGEIISSRYSDFILSKGSDSSLQEGAHALETIKDRLANFYNEPKENIFIFPSGMAAMSTIQRILVNRKPEGKTIQCDFPYVDVLKVQKSTGDGVELFLLDSPEEYIKLEQVVESNSITAIYGEIPSNPLLKTIDVNRISKLAKENKIPLVLDDTISSVVNVDLINHADLITSSLTKSFSGYGDVMAGAVVVSSQSNYSAEFREALSNESSSLWFDDAVSLEKNSRDFEERVIKSNQTALDVVEYLSGHQAVENVHYPSITSSGFYSQVARANSGHGCLLSFSPKNSNQNSPIIYDQLEFNKGPSLGTNFSLACPYTMLAHYKELDWAKDCDVDPYLLRLSIGLEEKDVIIKRLDNALQNLS